MPETPILRLENVHKSYGDTFAIHDVSLDVDRGELVCLLGPSGCGKTTLLRIIAGLESMDSGTISFDGQNVQGVTPHSRGFGLMFQDLALFPHMDVFGNVGFGLRMQGMSSDRVQMRVDEMLELVDLGNYRNRKIHELSGGERQRVALARSLAPAPKLLMLDEPLGSLDRVLRESLQVQVRSILKEIGVTAIYVTHDKDEAFALADTIVFVDRGAVVQAGPPEALFRAPATEMVARSLGLRNLIPGTIVRASDSVEVASTVGTLVAGGSPPDGMMTGDDVLVIINERGLSIAPVRHGSAGNGIELSGVINARKFRGGESEIHITVGQGEVVAIAPSNDAQSSLTAGDDIFVFVPPESITLLPPSQG
ncbi:MAG: ABC transporter ATP-binding protein [Dehalococcoidia bacterium]|jgi:ABC-type Fe3+/spermidine/putrescine transport system ATPase subunit|nr:ABC transporter ATP-binding protein [Dehalococcoidia bacterium]